MKINRAMPRQNRLRFSLCVGDSDEVGIRCSQREIKGGGVGEPPFFWFQIC